MKLIKNRVQILRERLNYLEYLYYVKSESKVSDEEYDILLEELRQLEFKYPYLITKSSSTQSISNVCDNSLNRIRHQKPMLSLNSIRDKSQLLLFDKRIKYKLSNHYNINQNLIVYCCELKIDGVALSILYKQGKLVHAATRGDGKIGENVTKNVNAIDSIPKNLKKNNNEILPDLLEIRGEIFISKLSFSKLNQEMLSSGKKVFSNARNAASGSLRQLDPHVTELRSLVFCCYGISYYAGLKQLPNSHWGRLKLCNRWGLSINNYIQIVSGIDPVLEYYNYVRKIRSELEYQIDGIVIKIDNCIYQDQLGCGFRAPNWAVAYKFPAELKLTKLNDVVFKVGRTGLITPIAYINPVVIGNVIIKKVNMHNVNEVKRLNLMIGDTVIVQRSGDVIPKILKIILENRVDNAKFIKIPEFCPSCGSILKVEDNKSSVLRCLAKLTCLAQRKSALKHFASRKAMNIQGMGSRVINQLVDKGLICTPVDFFSLSKEKLLCLDRYGEKSAERLLQSILIAKEITLSAFIYALGIPGVGESVSNKLAYMYRTIENLMNADLQSFLQLKFIGKIAAMNIYSFLHQSDNYNNIQGLIRSNLIFK
ncbi:DNA ligase [Candidatus Blochmanniella floridana]|uniref:DNA ligase n=1 Tax=Blochmanniella floridana TaxID=203907 RepID=DNLJ_BLOFL|nr:RecName: Full=DNA ligase; AltName: Full=Polydeoxyribonucleotide synthase [NAD(+)] [Candidatus Blochmannia floridanus]CAD83193.1 DNA ligase [Candidatus Blochmannia floridanus]